jgi:predicted Zn finger-like uncharacterized protein
MLIVCPACATAYNIETESLRPEGRQVRCVRCRAVWKAELSHADQLLAAADAIGPAPDVAAPAPFAMALQMPPAAEPAAAFAGEPDVLAEEPDVLAEEPDALAGEPEALADQPPDAEPEAEGPADVTPVEPEDPALTSVDDQAAADQPAGVADVEAPPIAPVDLDEGRPLLDIAANDRADLPAARHADIEAVAARRQARSAPRRAPRWPLSRRQTAVLALVFINVLVVGWRSDFVRALPQTASFYAAMGLPVNLRGLTFDGVTTAAEQHEGIPILVVEGNVVNDARKTVEVPRLKFIVRNVAHQEIYSWTAVPSRTALPPGEAVAFRTRLASPPPEARDVMVRFVTRRDIVGAVR